MKYLLTLFIYLTLIVNISAQNYKEVKIQLNSIDELSSIYELKMDLDHIQIEKDLSVSFFVSENDFLKLKGSSLNYEITIDDWYEFYAGRTKMTEAERRGQLSKSASKYGVTDFNFGSMGGYYTYDEVIAQLDFLQTSYSSIISAKEVIGTTNEGRDIYVVKISDNPDTDEDEPEVLYTALHHAREPESMMQMIYFMYYLLENYGSDDEVTHLVDNREMYFIPVVNPDGYVYNETTYPNGGGMWRKNRRSNPDAAIGVDLNRNYGPREYWDAPNGGSSSAGSSDVYRGLAPFSEPETAAIRDFLYTREIKNCLNYHSYGNWLIFPYGALEHETPDSSQFREFANDMTQFNHYIYGTDFQTVGYSTRGNSDDYMYDGDIDQKGKVFAMTPEVGSSSDYFWPAESRIIPLAEENIFPNLYHAWVAGGYASPSRLEISEEIIVPGDTVNISVDLKNKGLSDIRSASIYLSGSSNQIKILNEHIETNEIPAGESITLESLLQFVVNDEIESGTEIFIEIETYTEDVPGFVNEISFTVGIPSVIFADNSDTLEENWVSNSNVSPKWVETQSDYHSAPVSFTDSENGDYVSNSLVTMELKESIDLTGVKAPQLSFWTKYELESGWDYGQVSIKTETDNLWIAVGGDYSVEGSGSFQPAGKPVYAGSQYEWIKEIIDLTIFEDERIKIKFQLKSDGAVEMDGWYVDDIQIFHYVDNPSGVSDGSPYNNFTYSLEQNYPNPFNPATTIKYSIPGEVNSETSKVKLIIYDVLGEKVATLVNAQQRAGQYEVNWNASGQVSGVYFYKLTTGKGFTEVKKMLLIR